MKVRSRKPKNRRIYKTSKAGRPFWIEPVDTSLWFDSQKLEWIKDPESYRGLTSSYYSMAREGLTDAYSLKAVKRLIYKWKAPKGTTFRASLPYVGYDFFITK